MKTLLTAAVFVIAWSNACMASELVSVETDSSSVLPEYVRQVVTGAPADSVFLRVSLCALEGDGHIDRRVFILVEELKWPRPGPEYKIDIGGEAASTSGEDRQWLLRSSRISGQQLNQARRKIALPPPPTGARAGEIGGHLLRPFEFVAWVSPLKFVVDDGMARFVIERVGLGKFELVEVTRWH